MFRLQRRRHFWLDVTSLKFRRVYYGQLQQKCYWGHYHHLSSDQHRYKSRISRGMGTGMRICTPTKAIPVRRGLRVRLAVRRRCFKCPWRTLISTFLFSQSAMKMTSKLRGVVGQHVTQPGTGVKGFSRAA